MSGLPIHIIAKAAARPPSKLLGTPKAQTGEAAAYCSAMASWAASRVGWVGWAAQDAASVPGERVCQV